MSLNAEDVIMNDVITINGKYPVKYADSLMKYFGLGCLVVMDEKEPVGIITDSDIIQRVYAQGHDPHLIYVNQVMTQPLIWVKSDTPVSDAVNLMLEKDIKRVPVMGKLSTGPVLLGLLTRVETEKVIELDA